MSPTTAVLVIDDEPGIRDLLTWELSQQGFEVETAESGMAAVEVARRRRFDLAITDLKMPGMDGIATVEALRTLDPDIEVIVSTGYATVETAIACMKSGACAYIEKPYDLDELKALLDNALKARLQGDGALFEACRALLSTPGNADLVRIVLGWTQSVLQADDATFLVMGPADRVAIHRAEGSDSPPDTVLLALAKRAETAQAPLRLPAPGPDAAGLEPDAAAGCSPALVYPLSTGDDRRAALVVSRRVGSPAFGHSELRKGTVFASQLMMYVQGVRPLRPAD